jgi:hypothetical protein
LATQRDNGSAGQKLRAVTDLPQLLELVATKLRTALQKPDQLEKSREMADHLQPGRPASDNKELVKIGPADFFNGPDDMTIVIAKVKAT